MEIETEAKSFHCKTFVSKLNSIDAIIGSGWQGWKRIVTYKNCPPFKFARDKKSPIFFGTYFTDKIPLIFPC